MEGDAGPRQLTPENDEAERSEAEEADHRAPENDEAERSEAEEAPAAAEQPAPAAQRSRLYSRGWVVGACATLLVLAALVGGGGYLALRSNQQDDARAVAEAAAVQAAKDCVTATQAPDLAVMSASQQKIVECATGDFGAQASLYSGVLVDAYQAAKAQVQVSDIRAAVERHNGDGSMDVLVALRVKVSNSSVQAQETGYRLRVTMAEDNGAFKIADLQQVTK
jgi:Mce-associated membrane protein